MLICSRRTIFSGSSADPYLLGLRLILVGMKTGELICGASELPLPSCLVEEETRIGYCHSCDRHVPVYQEAGHWIYARHPFRAEPRPYIEVLPPE
jgi:hypothetical protein